MLTQTHTRITATHARAHTHTHLLCTHTPARYTHTYTHISFTHTATTPEDRKAIRFDKEVDSCYEGVTGKAKILKSSILL
jgi:hypothetical protein